MIFNKWHFKYHIYELLETGQSNIDAGADDIIKPEFPHLYKIDLLDTFPKF